MDSALNGNLNTEYPQSSGKLGVRRGKTLITSAKQAGRQVCLTVWEHGSRAPTDQIATKHEDGWAENLRYFPEEKVCVV